MCTEIMVIRNGVEFDCETVGQLASALGLQPADVSEDDPEFCLCNAYIEKLGARRATTAEGWPFPEWVIEVNR